MNLKTIRELRKLTIPQLSKISSVPVRTIEDIERRGDCRVSTAIKLAEALEISLDDLCGKKE